MVEMFSGSAYNTQNSCQPKLWLANTNEGPLRNWSAFREWIRSSVFPNNDQFTNRIFWSRSNVACEQALRAAGGNRKESLNLRLWNLNICIEKVDAKCWLAEMTLVMTSLPLARVFQCLFTFALVSDPRWLAKIWQLSRRGATGELEVELKFQRCSCKLSFLFPPSRQSVPQSLFAGYVTAQHVFCL